MVRRFSPLHFLLLGLVLLVAATGAWAKPEHPASDVRNRVLSFEGVAASAEPASLDPEPITLPDAPELPEAVQDDFGRAYALYRLGDYAAADALFGAHVDDPDATVAAEALFRRGLAALRDDRFQDAVDAFSALRDRFPDAQQAAEAPLPLASARRALGDCAGAIGDYQTLAQTTPSLAANAHALEAQCYQALGQPENVIAAEQKVLDASPPRLLRLEALEAQADAYLKLGSSDTALDIYGALLDQARTRAYTAWLLYTIGQVHRDLGNTDRAITRLTSVVTDYPESGQAGAALDALNDLSASDHISWYQAGLVRMYQRRLSQAISAFDQALAEGLDDATARDATYYRGISKVRIDDTDGGVADLVSVADHWSDTDLAPLALLRAGEARESFNQWPDAIALFQRLESSYPDSASAAEARFQHGIAQFAQGDVGSASATWTAALDHESRASSRARLLLWKGKALMGSGDGDGAKAAWKSAVDADSESFAGLRANDLLAGNDSGLVWPPGDLKPPADGDVDAWLQSEGEDPATVQDDIAADPRFQRGSTLLRLAQPSAARRELDELMADMADKPGRLYVLASMLHDRGAYDVSFAAAQASLAALPADEPLLAAPGPLLRLAYPIVYPELLDKQRVERNVDPLLMLALIRQESAFSPTATSVADARGLTQVLPSTGQGIAARLGYEDFQADDLYKPVVSLDFGATFLSDTLNRFGNRVYPALAAYNAGAGAADQWLTDYGDDMDLWAERIPYPETYGYVQKVFTYYGRYRLVYGQTG